MEPSPRQLRNGFTLIEAVIALVIVATMLVASLEAIATSARLGSRQLNQGRGLLLARGLLDEIVQHAYADPDGGSVLGPDDGEAARNDFNDVDDYNGYSEMPPAAIDGATRASDANWRRSVVVEWVNLSNLTTASGSDTGLKRITVTVIEPSGAQTKLVALRSRYSGYEQAPGATITYVSQVQLTLQVGTDSRGLVVSSVLPLNQVP